MLIMLQYIRKGKIPWLVSLTSAVALLSKTQKLRRSVREGSFQYVLLLYLVIQRSGAGGGSSVGLFTFVSTSCFTFNVSSEHVLYP